MSAAKANTALRAASARLLAGGIVSGVGDARALLAFAMDVSPDRLTLHLNDDLTVAAAVRFQAAIAARLQHRPVSQIVGGRLFWGHWFRVTQDTLDPRPETEILVAEAVRRPFVKMLDLGTGTGCILLSCLASMPTAIGIGIDVSEPALAVAAGNARALGLENRVQWLRSDWFGEISGRFDLIVSNPPYIAAEEMASLSPDVLNWEPHQALSPGGDGLDVYRTIAREAPSRLLAGGRLLLEIGPTQAVAVTELLAAQGLQEIRVLQDLDGRDRVVEAARKDETSKIGDL